MTEKLSEEINSIAIAMSMLEVPFFMRFVQIPFIMFIASKHTFYIDFHIVPSSYLRNDFQWT